MTPGKLRGRGIAALAAAVLLSFALGFALGHGAATRLRVPSEDVFKTDPSQVLGATVDSLKAENKLIVYRFSGQARVDSSGTYAWLLRGDQELIVPASAVYFVDMSQFKRENVRYDAASKTVLVKLPPLKIGDVAMQPENAIQINKGLVTISNDVVAELARKNYAAARVAFVRQAQQTQFVALAQAAATQSVASNFAIPLRALGRKDITIKVTI
jgi:hypothetical protein